MQHHDVIVKYLGAARGIGGSMLSVTDSEHTILLDCGRPIRGPREAQSAFPIDPQSVDAIIVSHAHQDHAGWLFDFLSAGFAGPIYSTFATRDLIAVQLAETIRRFRNDRRVDSIVHSKRGPSVDWSSGRVLDRFRCIEIGSTIETEIGATVTLQEAGHLLGAAGVLLEWHGRSVYFTGDVGRDHSPLYPPPAELRMADLIVSESTYGDRAMESFNDAAARFGATIAQSLDDGGRAIIPAFSLGRMQLVLFAISENMKREAFSPVPILVDSPTARPFAEVHRKYRKELRDVDIEDAWFGDNITYVESDDDSRDFVTTRSPAIILVAGGMADSYRAKRHIRANIDDPRSRIILVSFQAPGTLGRRLIELGPTIRIDGKNHNKWAEVVQLGGFSGHADRDELIKLLTPLGRTGRPIHLVHGEMTSAQALAQSLSDHGCGNVGVPALGDLHRLSSSPSVG